MRKIKTKFYLPHNDKFHMLAGLRLQQISGLTLNKQAESTTASESYS